jgi:hypothetical protein
VFWTLDQLEELSKQCEVKGSCFEHCFEYVLNATSGTGAQYFVFQANDAIAGESIFM